MSFLGGAYGEVESIEGETAFYTPPCIDSIQSRIPSQE